jgi:hypothetical protein
MIAVVAMLMVRDLAVMAMVPAVMGELAMSVMTTMVSGMVMSCVLAMMATVAARGRGFLVAVF